MKRVILPVFLLFLPVLAGCQLGKDLLGLTERAARDEALQREIADIARSIEAIREEAEQTGKIDISKVLILQERLADAQRQLIEATEEEPWYFQLLYLIVAALVGGTTGYPIARKIRLLVTK